MDPNRRMAEPGRAGCVAHPLLTRLESLAAKVTLKDIELLGAGPARERLETVHDLVFVAVTGSLQLGLWTLVFAMFGVPPVAAFAVGLLVATVVVLIDIRMLASDTHPRGVLRNGPHRKDFWAKLGARLLISLVLSNVTAVGVDLIAFRDEAVEAMEADRDHRNQPILTEYEAGIQAARQRVLGPADAHRATLLSRRATAARAAATAQQAADAAYSESQAADLERERQVGGVMERVEGDGPLAKDAAKRRDLARERISYLAAQRKEAEVQDRQAAQELAAADAQLAAAQAQLNREIATLRRERDDRLQQATNGPLTVVLGMLKLRSDPVYRPAVLLVSLLAWSGIMVLELGFFLSRSVFRAASVHDLGVNTDARRRAADMAHHFSDHIQRVRQRHPLRVVGDNDAVELGDNSDA
jgi:hypothetical protein